MTLSTIDPRTRMRTTLRRLATAVVSTLVVLGALPLQHAGAAPPPSVTIGDVSVTEGAGGTTVVAKFTLTLSEVARKPIGVKFVTQDGTATAGQDYVAANGTATIKKGSTTRKISIVVNGDDVFEGDEDFTVHLTHARGASIDDANGIGTIVEDDAVPGLRIADASVLEGTGGTAQLAFDVTLTGAAASDVSVDYASVDDSATSPADYSSVNDTLTWAAGTNGTQTVLVDVVTDPVDEVDETLNVTLSNATGGATIERATALGVILDDDLPPATPPSASTTTIKVLLRKAKTIAKGAVTPAHTGLQVTVTLYKRKSGAWNVIGVKTPVLGTATDRDGDGIFSSPYKAAFKRLRGRQKVVVQFAGDTDHLASSATKVFKRK